MLSESARKAQSVWENAGDPKPKPEEEGAKHDNKSDNVPITVFDNYIKRWNHRSHKPYGKDVDVKFFEKIVDAWTKDENDTMTKICKDIAEATQGILNHTVQKQTYIVAVIEAAHYVPT